MLKLARFQTNSKRILLTDLVVDADRVVVLIVDAGLIEAEATEVVDIAAVAAGIGISRIAGRSWYTAPIVVAIDRRLDAGVADGAEVQKVDRGRRAAGRAYK